MKKLMNRFSLLIAWLMLAGLVPVDVEAGVHPYSYPDEIPVAGDFRVWADGREILVYDTPVAGMASFGSTGDVEVKVWIEYPFESIDIRPKNLCIEPEIDGHYVSFILPENQKISVEFDKHIYRPLFVFTGNPISPGVKAGADVIFAAGKKYDLGIFYIQSGQTVLIEGGAILEGSFVLENIQDATIIGHGIVDNRNLSRRDGYYGLVAVNSKKFSINNLHVIGNPRWTTAYFACDEFTINDIRIIGWRPSDDGIDIVGCQDVHIDQSFIRSKDDCIVIKATAVNNYFLKSPAGKDKPDCIGCRDVRNILVTGTTFWNAEWGNAIEIGFETRAEVMYDMRIEDCDIIHVEGNGGVFSIHNGDRAIVRDVVYKNIRIEDARGYLCHFQILHSHYSNDGQRGNCENIRLEDIVISEGVPLNSIITGFDNQHIFRDVYFKNLIIHGREIKSVFEANIFSEFARNIQFE